MSWVTAPKQKKPFTEPDKDLLVSSRDSKEKSSICDHCEDFHFFLVLRALFFYQSLFAHSDH